MKCNKLLITFLLILCTFIYLIFFKNVETNPEILLEQKLQKNITPKYTSTIDNTHYLLFTIDGQLGIASYKLAFNGSPQFKEISYTPRMFELNLSKDKLIIGGLNPNKQISYATLTTPDTNTHYIPIPNKKRPQPLSCSPVKPKQLLGILMGDQIPSKN